MCKQTNKEKMLSKSEYQNFFPDIDTIPFHSTQLSSYWLSSSGAGGWLKRPQMMTLPVGICQIVKDVIHRMWQLAAAVAEGLQITLT